MSQNTTIIPIDASVFSQDATRYSKLISQFHRMCEDEFSKEELEPLSDWIEGLENENEDHHGADAEAEKKSLPEFYAVYMMMTTKTKTENAEKHDEEADETVFGGVVLECYPRQKIFLMAYVVVSEKCRGQGVGRKLVDACRKWAANSFGTIFPFSSSTSLSWKPVLLIEVYQTKNVEEKLSKIGEHDDDEKKSSLEQELIATANRQKVWSKLGFLPLKDVDLVHPGKLKGGVYNIAVMSCGKDDGDDDIIIALDQLKSWLLLFFKLILGESCEDEEEGEEEEDLEELALEHFKNEIRLPETKYLEAGNEFWC